MNRPGTILVPLSSWLVGLGWLGAWTNPPAAGVAPAETDPALAEVDAFIAAQQIDRSGPGWRGSLPKPPRLPFDPATAYSWNVVTTHGNLKIELDAEVAPEHVSCVIYLSRLGFYDGLTLHRIIPRFVAQGGCPVGDGTGGPGFWVEREIHPDVRHDESGVVGAANGGPGTDGSQFYVTFTGTPHLDGENTIFGRVTNGWSTLTSLEKVGSRGGIPVEEVEIERTTISTERITLLPSSPSGADPALTAIDEFIQANQVDRGREAWRLELPRPPLVDFDPGKRYLWHLRTRGGDLTIELLPEAAPMHVSNTIYLTKIGFYDSLKFHRIFKGMLIQAGCPVGNGSGHPGYFLDLEVESKARHLPGAVSASSLGKEGTEGSQFFICVKQQVHLDGKNSVFGRVLNREVLDKIATLGSTSGAMKGRLVRIDNATISVEER